MLQTHLDVPAPILPKKARLNNLLRLKSLYEVEYEVEHARTVSECADRCRRKMRSVMSVTLGRLRVAGAIYSCKNLVYTTQRMYVSVAFWLRKMLFTGTNLKKNQLLLT